MPYAKYFLSKAKPAIDPKVLKLFIKRALIEDIGKNDITTTLIIPTNKKIKACLVANENFLICGLAIAKNVFTQVDSKIDFKARVKEGSCVKAGAVIAVISGNAANILKAERVSLNLLSMLSGIASRTKEYVDKVKPYGVKIVDTRKTFPGLRELSKYAVRIGGGYNHRIRLDEMILIKDNHIKVIAGCFKLPPKTKNYKLEIEAQSFKEFLSALKLKPDVIMLDNMKISDIKKAVKTRNWLKSKNQDYPQLEASGGINLNNIRKYASTGVNIISIGELTDSVKSTDISLDVL